MVQLTVTPAVLAALEHCRKNDLKCPFDIDNLKLGSPIAHHDIITISQLLRNHEEASHSSEIPTYSLAVLLRGSQVYIEPPKPKKEPTDEYKALMARLREEQEELQYDRMMNSAQPTQAYGQTSSVLLFPPISKQEEDEEVTLADVNRQVTLIFNILISIIACAVAIWMATRWWPTPQRLGVSMGGGGLVGVAEVVVYAGYLRRVKEAKQKEKRKIEKKEIIDTWVAEPKKAPVIVGDRNKTVSSSFSKPNVRQRPRNTA